MLIAVLKLQMVNPAVFSGEIFDKISTWIESDWEFIFSSKVSDGCECVQRRCHLHEFPSAKVFSPLSIQFKHGFVFLGTFLWLPYQFLMWVKLNDASKVPSECRGKNMAGQSTWVLNSCYSQISVSAMMTVTLQVGLRGSANLCCRHDSSGDNILEEAENEFTKRTQTRRRRRWGGRRRKSEWSVEKRSRGWSTPAGRTNFQRATELEENVTITITTDTSKDKLPESASFNNPQYFSLLLCLLWGNRQQII